MKFLFFKGFSAFVAVGIQGVFHSLSPSRLPAETLGLAMTSDTQREGAVVVPGGGLYILQNNWNLLCGLPLGPFYGPGLTVQMPKNLP